jgi:hypothetical protein
MDLSTKHYGLYGDNPSTIIELTVSVIGIVITEDVTDLHGRVDEALINTLRNIADELEEQNIKIKERDLPTA